MKKKIKGFFSDKLKYLSAWPEKYEIGAKGACRFRQWINAN